MSKKHDAIFDDVLSGLGDEAEPKAPRAGARFLKRSTTIGDRLSGEREEKTLLWVDPEDCRMWDRHNRAYDLLNEDNCGDLIDGIRAQGRQEFPAIVRRLSGEDKAYEVICGARRHFAVSWLRANNYPQFKYLVEVRDLTDEEAFRLSDIENRDRDDISDYERAVDYAGAIEAFYGGRQRTMAERLEVSEGWLSRYLTLAKLPKQIVDAYASIRDIKESHARALKPLLANPDLRDRVLDVAAGLERQQDTARAGQGAAVEGPAVINALRGAGKSDAKPKDTGQRYRRGPGETGITAKKRGKAVVLEFREGLSRASLEAAFGHFLKAYSGAGNRFPKE